MDRRKFLKVLGLGVAGAAAVSVLDPDIVGWVKGAKKIFLPAPKPVNYVIGVDFAFPTRVDCIYGFATLRPDLACRVFDADSDQAILQEIIKPACRKLADKIYADIFKAYTGKYPNIRFREDAFSLAMA